MQKSTVFFALLLSFMSIVHGNNRYCKRYENKIYRVKVTFPDLEPLHAIVRLLPGGMFDELFSIAGGHNKDEVGVDFALSNRVGYYSCATAKKMYLTGYGFLYKTHGVEFLKKNGATVMHDYSFRFSSNGKKLHGKVRFAAYKCGTDPFDEHNKPVHEGPIGIVTGERVKFRRNYDLSTESHESHESDKA
jgi:hypothetical protein